MPKKQEEKTESAPKRDWKFLVIFPLVALLLILAIGAGGYYLGLRGASDAGQEEQDSEQEKRQSAFSFGSDEYLGPLVELDSFVVNITDADQTRYLKIGMTMEASDKKTRDEINLRLPQVRDAVIFELSGKTFDQLRDLQGKKQLQAELIKSLNDLLDKGRVVSLFFTEFVVQ